MKEKLIERESQCIRDCIILASVAHGLGNIEQTKQMLEDALKSVREIEKLSDNETIVLLGKIGIGSIFDE